MPPITPEIAKTLKLKAGDWYNAGDGQFYKYGEDKAYSTQEYESLTGKGTGPTPSGVDSFTGQLGSTSGGQTTVKNYVNGQLVDDAAYKAHLAANPSTSPVIGKVAGAATGQTPTGMQTETAPKPQQPMQPAQTPQTFGAPASQPFNYQPSTRTDAQLLAAARARAAQLIGTQRQDAQAGYAQAQQLAADQKQGLNREEASATERNRMAFAGRNLATSGFMAGANAQVQAATQQERGKIEAQQSLAQQALQARLAQLNNLQNESEIANYDQLLQMERTFGLQERGQQFGEYSANRDFGLRQADLGSVLAQRAFELQRGQSLLPGELQGQSLGNQTAAFNLSRGQQMLPYELQGAGLANQQAQFNLGRGQSLLPGEILSQYLANQGAGISNQTAQAQYNDQYTTGGLGYQYRQGQITGQNIANQTGQFNLDSAREMQPIQVRAQELANEQRYWQNQLAMLNYQIANDQDVGARSQAIQARDQANAQLQLINAQIAQTNAETANIGKTGGTNGLTPYQQWQIESGITEKEQAARNAQVQRYTGSYSITPIAGEVWVDLDGELSKIQSQTGGLDKTKANEILRDLKSTPGLTDQDAAWLDAMFDQRFGDIGAPSRLRTYLKGYKPPQDDSY